MNKLGDLYVLTDEQRKQIGLSIVVAIATLEPPRSPDHERALTSLYTSLKLVDLDEWKLQRKNHDREYE